MKKLILTLLILLSLCSFAEGRAVVGLVAAPTLQSATIGTDGVTWTMGFDQTMEIGAGGSGGMVGTVGTGTISLAMVSGTNSNTFVFTGTPTVYTGSTATLTYTQPGSGLTNFWANPLASFSGHAVTNNSTQGGESEESITGATVFSSQWTGSDIINTGAGTGHVWTSSTNVNNWLTLGTTTNYGFAGKESTYLLLSGTVGDFDGYLNEDLTSTTAIGLRVGLYVTSGIGGDTHLGIVAVNKAGSSGYLIRSFVYRAAGPGAYEIHVECQVADESFKPLGSITITTGVWYQLIIKWQKNTVSGASFEVYNASGQVGTTQTLDGAYTTYNENVDKVKLGNWFYGPSTAVARYDALKVNNTYAFPDMLSW